MAVRCAIIPELHAIKGVGAGGGCAGGRRRSDSDEASDRTVQRASECPKALRQPRACLLPRWAVRRRCGRTFVPLHVPAHRRAARSTLASSATTQMSPAPAVPVNLIVNGGFEDLTGASDLVASWGYRNTAPNGVIPGWTQTKPCSWPST